MEEEEFIQERSDARSTPFQEPFKLIKRKLSASFGVTKKIKTKVLCSLGNVCFFH